MHHVCSGERTQTAAGPPGDAQPGSSLGSGLVGGGEKGQGGCRDQPIQTQATSLQHLTTNLAARQRSHSDDKLKDEKIKIKKSERAAQLLNRSQARICSQSGWWCIRGELGLHTLPPAAAGSHLIYSLWKAHSVGRAFPFWACEHIRCLLLM